MLKKFEEYDDERQENIQEFEESEGYPLGLYFLFAPYKSEGWTERTGVFETFQFVVCPKSFWDNNGHCYDQHIGDILIDMPDGFGEACESDFEYDGSDIKEAIDKLAKDGQFVWNKQFQSFIDQSSSGNGPLTIDGQSVEDYIKTNYPNIIV